MTENTNFILSKNDILFSLDATNDDVPYELRLQNTNGEEEKIVVLPYCMETNDISLCLSGNYTPKDYGDALIDYVKQ